MSIILTTCPDCGASPAESRCECDFAGVRAQRRINALEARCRAAEEAKEAARERWAECQDRLAELERLAQSLTGEETDIATNLRALHGQVAERDKRIAELEAALSAEREDSARLKAALEPFADLARKFSDRATGAPCVSDEDRLTVEYVWLEFLSVLRVRDLRTVLAAIDAARKERT